MKHKHNLLSFSVRRISGIMLEILMLPMKAIGLLIAILGIIIIIVSEE
jgi:hypothetical protein